MRRSKSRDGDYETDRNRGIKKVRRLQPNRTSNTQPTTEAATGLLYGPAAAFTRRKAAQYGKIGGRR